MKSIIDLNIRSETVKLLEENIGGKFHDIGFDFWDMTSKVQVIKGKINRWDYFKLKSSVQQRKPTTK